MCHLNTLYTPVSERKYVSPKYTVHAHVGRKYVSPKYTVHAHVGRKYVSPKYTVHAHVEKEICVT